MGTIDPNIIIPALFLLISTLGTACCGGTFTVLTVVVTAWINNRSAHNRHETTTKENTEILDKTVEVKWSVEQQKQFAASRFEELQADLNKCKNELNEIKRKVEKE